MISYAEIIKALVDEDEYTDSGVFFVVNREILNLKICLNYKQRLIDELEDDDLDTCEPQIIVKRSSPGICRVYIETCSKGECETIYETLITDGQAVDLCEEMS